MPFNANQVVVNNENVSSKIVEAKGTLYQEGNNLTPQDIEYLLSVLKDATIRGHQVEMFYNLILKLQNQYISITKK